MSNLIIILLVVFILLLIIFILLVASKNGSEDSGIKERLDRIEQKIWFTNTAVERLPEGIETIIIKTNKIIMNEQELAQALRDAAAQNRKAKDEIMGKISNLETAIANVGNTTPEVDSALAELKSSGQSLDDIVPDAPPVEGGDSGAPEESAGTNG
jgi:chromosome segregation ATPase